MVRRFQTALVLGLWLLGGGAAAGEPALGPRVEAFIRANASSAVQRIELPELSALEPAPGLEVRLSVHPRTRFEGSVPITIRYLSGGREVRREVLTARVTRAHRVLRATRALRRGDRVRPGDVEEVTLAGSAVPRDPISGRHDVVGRRTIRAVAAGAVWRRGWVEHAPAVSRGDPVMLVVSHGGLRIQARGRARENAEVGDLVRVINVDSRREVVGRVQNDGAVHVLD